MPPCDVCGESDGLAYTCNECGGKYCSNHRLPESHHCDGLRFTISRESNPDDDSERSTITRRKGGNRHGEHATNHLSGGTGLSIVGVLSWVLLPVFLAWEYKRVLVVLGIVVATASIMPGVPPESFLSESDTAAVGETVSSVTAGVSSALNSSGELLEGESYNETEVEMAIHERVNEIRVQRGLSRLEYNEEFASRAAEHSQRMNESERLFHSEVRSQYPRCSAVGENVAFTFASQDIRTETGSVNYYGNETAIGYGIVGQWMNSPGHRENILDPRWGYEGVGVAFSETEEGTRVYATQAFCG